jgi:DNA-directed RNA polymerase specialized sigma24 family protein
MIFHPRRYAADALPDAATVERPGWRPVGDDPFGDATADDPLDLLHAVRREATLHAQLAKLDPLRRQVIALAFFRGMTHDGIADHTGLPLGTVKSHFRRTLAALHSALGPDFSRSPTRSPQ